MMTIPRPERMTPSLSRLSWSAGTLLIIVLSNTLCLSATYLDPFSSWMVGCEKEHLSCPEEAAALLQQEVDFVYAELSGLPQLVSQSQVSQACSSKCVEETIPGLNATLMASMAGGSPPPACPFFRDPHLFTTLADSVLSFTCVAEQGAAGVCVQSVAQSLRGANLLSTMMSFQPDIEFQGDLLYSTCQALAPTGCCLRTWAALWGALAQQLCLPDLARELLSLPGRCQIVLGAPVSAACIPGWEGSLLSLLQPLASSCANVSDSDSAALLAGSYCSPASLARQSCFTHPCDVWCGLLGAVRDARLESTQQGSDTGGSGSSGLSGGKIAAIVVCACVAVIATVILLALFVAPKAVGRRSAATAAPANQLQLTTTTTSDDSSPLAPSLAGHGNGNGNVKHPSANGTAVAVAAGPAAARALLFSSLDGGGSSGPAAVAAVAAGGDAASGAANGGAAAGAVAGAGGSGQPGHWSTAGPDAGPMGGAVAAGGGGAASGGASTGTGAGTVAVATAAAGGTAGALAALLLSRATGQSQHNRSRNDLSGSAGTFPLPSGASAASTASIYLTPPSSFGRSGSGSLTAAQSFVSAVESFQSTVVVISNGPDAGGGSELQSGQQSGALLVADEQQQP